MTIKRVTNMALNEIEEEVVLLKAIKELIDSMVNFEILTVSGNDPDSSILFKTVIHQCLFNITTVRGKLKSG